MHVLISYDLKSSKTHAAFVLHSHVVSIPYLKSNYQKCYISPIRHTDEFRFCCIAKGVEKCFPEPDEFSSCEDLMSNAFLRMCLWIQGIIAFVGNLIVIIWRLKNKRDNKVMGSVKIPGVSKTTVK